MGYGTIIAWTQHTWNPWRGCTRISPGCDHCYMFTAQERYGNDPSTVTRTKTWGEPIKWQREAEARGRIETVFTCSWSDWFHRSADAWRDEAWALIKRCPNLHFQILTKRIIDVPKRLPADWGSGYPNVWLGTSIESSDFLWRSDYLRKIPARVRFISAEPLLGPLSKINLDGIHWLIVGGESGPGFRSMDASWARDLLEKARRSNVAYFFKQSSGIRTEMGTELDGATIKEYPINLSVTDDAMELSRQ